MAAEQRDGPPQGVAEDTTNIAVLRERMERFLDHLARFAATTAAGARRMLVPVRVYAAVALLAAVVVSWRLGLWVADGSLLGFFAWLLPMSLPAALLFGFYFLFHAVASLPKHIDDLRELVAGLAPGIRSQLDDILDRSEGRRFSLGRIVALGRVLLELRHIASSGADLPRAFAMAPMMANPLFWLLFGLSCLTAAGVIGVAALLIAIALL